MQFGKPTKALTKQVVVPVHWARKGMINTYKKIPNYYSIQMVWKIWLPIPITNTVACVPSHSGKLKKVLKLKGSL